MDLGGKTFCLYCFTKTLYQRGGNSISESQAIGFGILSPSSNFRLPNVARSSAIVRWHSWGYRAQGRRLKQVTLCYSNRENHLKTAQAPKLTFAEKKTLVDGRGVNGQNDSCVCFRAVRLSGSGTAFERRRLSEVDVARCTKEQQHESTMQPRIPLSRCAGRSQPTHNYQTLEGTPTATELV